VIAREGLVPVIASGLAGVLVVHYAGLVASLVVWLIFLLLVLFFRDPERDIPAVPLAVVSPADGRVASVGQQHDPYLERQSIRVTLEMNPYGIFSTRSPVEGKVMEPPNIPDGDTAPHGVWIQTDETDDVVMVMNRGRLHNSPRCYIGFGERVGQGQRCGFIHLGARIDLYLPETSRTEVTPGDHVRAGADVIARLVHART
jgi:phosphatidylserine decarboxylase